MTTTFTFPAAGDAEGLLVLCELLDGRRPALCELLDAGPAAAPTSVPPGPLKVEVLAERARLGRQLFHKDDADGCSHVSQAGLDARRRTAVSARLNSPEARAVLLDGLRSGATCRRLASTLRCSPASVSRYLRRLREEQKVVAGDD